MHAAFGSSRVLATLMEGTRTLQKKPHVQTPFFIFYIDRVCHSD